MELAKIIFSVMSAGFSLYYLLAIIDTIRILITIINMNYAGPLKGLIDYNQVVHLLLILFFKLLMFSIFILLTLFLLEII